MNGLECKRDATSLLVHKCRIMLAFPAMALFRQALRWAISDRIGLKGSVQAFPPLTGRFWYWLGVFGHDAVEYFSIQRRSARRLNPSLRAVSLLFPSHTESVASRCFLITSAKDVLAAGWLGVKSRR